MADEPIKINHLGDGCSASSRFVTPDDNVLKDVDGDPLPEPFAFFVTYENGPVDYTDESGHRKTVTLQAGYHPRRGLRINSGTSIDVEVHY
jgi:hypothetical protein